MYENDSILTDEELEELIFNLEGSDYSLEEICESMGIDIDDLTTGELQIIYDRLFFCTSCEFWCNIEEQYDEDICIECYEKEDEDNC